MGWSAIGRRRRLMCCSQKGRHKFPLCKSANGRPKLNFQNSVLMEFWAVQLIKDEKIAR
jgi:hypothetical protein